MPDSPARWRIVTPRTGPGALAAIELAGDGVDDALKTLGIGAVGVGRVALRDLCGVDRGVVARWSTRCALLMPHGGVEILRALVEQLSACGLERNDTLGEEGLRDAYPEAADLVEARMLEALARAASPRAIDLLLDQPRRWRLHGQGRLPGTDMEHSRVLRRLIDPALAVVVGATNIGKSTLINALARREVSIVADEEGTTRDHVGVQVDLDGIVVRLVDTPGIREAAPGVELEAARAAGLVVEMADLVLLAGDAANPPPPPIVTRDGRRIPSITVALRSDLGAAAPWAADVVTSARRGDGVEHLAARIRESLVQESALADPRPWQFWDVP